MTISNSKNPVRVTFVTLDGLSTHLGFAQGFEIVRAMSERGVLCTIVSLEPEHASAPQMKELERRCRELGVGWLHAPYERGGVRAAAGNVARLTRMLMKVRHRTDVFHARSYVAAFAPACFSLLSNTPWIFDTRAYWLDEKRAAGRWFQDRLTWTVARRVERGLYHRASAIVSLTELAAQDIRDGKFGRWPRTKPSVCIPTCTDFERFGLERALNPPDPILGLGPTLAYVGSINPSYEVEASLDFASAFLAADATARFVCLTAQVDAMDARVTAAGMDMSRVLVKRVAHDDMPKWLPWFDYGLLLLKEGLEAKRASMPTKLAEFLACGVEPIQFGCNAEVREWVQRSDLGIAVDSLERAELRTAAAKAVEGRASDASKQFARSLARSHFSLEAAAQSYQQLAARLSARRPS